MKTRPVSSLITFICLPLLCLIALCSAARGSQAQPFDLQFKDQDGHLITGEVRVLCFTSAEVVAPFADLIIRVIDGAPENPLPAACSHLAALRLRHSQPAGKRPGFAYQIYATSWQPGETTPLPAAGDITVSDRQPLTLFHLVASLGWTPAPDSDVTSTADIYAAVQAASTLLYDWSEGQMAFGTVRIYTGGEHWAEADLRFLPANDKQPSVFVGGIVPAPLTYMGSLANTTYTPAATYFGRLWNGHDAFVEGDGRWREFNAYRTIAHEWAHYALFLYDEYQNSEGLSGYCICDNLPTIGCRTTVPDASAMAYHYRPVEFWHQATHLVVSDFCYQTWQFHVHGESDWDTLSRWHTIQGLPVSFAPLNPPAEELTSGTTPGLAAHLFGREAGDRIFLPFLSREGSAVGFPAEPSVAVLIDVPVSPATTLSSQVYLLKGNPDEPERILPQGQATGEPVGNAIGQIRLLDVAPDDAIRAYVNRFGSGQQYTVYANEYPAGDIVTLTNTWAYTLEHRFTLESNRVVSLTLTLRDEDNRLIKPLAQICSLDAAIGCHPAWRAFMERSGGWWQVQFTPLPGQWELPRYLVARIADDKEPAVEKEVVQWLEVAGGIGPTHNDGMAPLLDGRVMVNAPVSNAPVSLDNAGDCNVVSYMPALNRDALQTPLPPAIGGLLSVPLDISITLTANKCPFLPGKPVPLTTPVLLNLGYSQDAVDRLGLNEQTQLKILHYVPETGWETCHQGSNSCLEISRNSDLNWIAVRTVHAGIYAIGWQP